MNFNFGKDNLTSKIAIGIVNGDNTTAIDNDTEARIKKSEELVLRLANSDEAVYGINTGFGPLCTTKISHENLKKLQHNILISHSVGVGENIDAKIAKMMLVLKLHSLCRGYSGIRLNTIKRIKWFLDNNIIPIVPAQGSVGASGDLAPLAHLFLPLIGLGYVQYQGKELEASEILTLFKKDPIHLAAKEGLALINGTQFIAAHAVFAVDEMYNLLSLADICAAIMIEGLQGSCSPFRAELHELRPFKGNIHVAHRLHTLIHNSEVNLSHINCSKVQDPYSLRCVPQVHGSSRDAWLHLKERVEIEINSVTDNPVILETGEPISGGNFHGQPLAMTLDYIAIAAAELGNIADRRIYLALEGDGDRIPKLLMKDTGVNSGFMIFQYTTAALVSENKSLCFPASVDSIPTSLGQEDHVSMGSISGRKALEVIGNLEKILAIELICACQLLDFSIPLKPHPVLDQVIRTIREEIPNAEEDRLFSADINKAIGLVKSNRIIENFNEKIENEYNELRSKYHEEFEIY